MKTRKRFSFNLVLRPEDKELNPYRFLPFSVPPGVRTIEIQYFYDKGEDNIIDLGLFDPRGSGFLNGLGFRGWSGSARNYVVISESWATPGYLAGPIHPGVWQVLLGLYKITNYCACEVHISLLDEPVKGESSVHLLPEKTGLFASGWLKGDLHCHTCHSDAEGTVEEVWAAARAKGLHFLAITDHNTVSHLSAVRELSKEHALILPGQEVTTYKGHANVFGLWDWVDFRCTKDEEISKICEFVHTRNGIFSINHPKTNGPNWEFSMNFAFDCIEVWQAFWHLNNSESLALWDSLLQKRRKVLALGGSDAHPRHVDHGHLLEWIGCPTVWVYTNDASLEGLFQAIKRGHISISACPHGPLIEIWLLQSQSKINQGEATDFAEGKLCARIYNGEGFYFRVISSKGLITQTRVTSNLWEWINDLDLAEQGYVRAELRVGLPGGISELAALSNPIWYRPWLESEEEA
ncbi:MAG: CehA/McbA family metallohydrolase [Candidatus Bathyarchaeia archaeon]